MECPWEDYLLERKTEGDLKDLLKTMVAFANSVRPGHTAVILIGEADEGTVKGVTNPDNIQKKVRLTAEGIYPPIVWRSEVYGEGSTQCVRVEIEYSGETPHFGGAAGVRQGSDTVKATDNIFQKLIELRSDKVRELTKWLGRKVTVRFDDSTLPFDDRGVRITKAAFADRWQFGQGATLISVNSFWITLQKENGPNMSEPITKVVLSFDDPNERLLLIVDRY